MLCISSRIIIAVVLLYKFDFVKVNHAIVNSFIVNESSDGDFVNQKIGVKSFALFLKKS
jgi:hypothetical protein